MIYQQFNIVLYCRLRGKDWNERPWELCLSTSVRSLKLCFLSLANGVALGANLQIGI